MTWIVRLYLFSICILLFVACSGKQRSHTVGKDTDREEATVIGFDYADTLRLEVHFAEWLKGVLQLPEDAKRETVHKLMSDGNEYPESQLKLMEIAEHYLADPNSPVRDEEMFIAVLEAFIESPGIDDDLKLRPTELLKVAKMNRKGTIANDFGYVDRNGVSGRLHELPGEYTVIYFFNPECADCKRASELLANCEALTKKVKEKKLTVMALYPDEDTLIWERHCRELPEEWTVARYATRDDASSYDLPAIPMLYLLDKDKRVISKDITPEILCDSITILFSKK